MIKNPWMAHFKKKYIAKIMLFVPITTYQKGGNFKIKETKAIYLDIAVVALKNGA